MEIRKKAITTENGGKHQAVLVFATVLEKLITILHPFMPFITEEIRSHLGLPELLVTSHWPTVTKSTDPAKVNKANKDKVDMQLILKIVDEVRAIRGEYSLPPGHGLELKISCEDESLLSTIENNQDVITSLEKISSLTVEAHGTKPAFSASGMFPGGRIFMPLEGILDPAAERTRLTKELGKVEGYALAQEKKLANENFVKSAPADIVETEREKLRSQKDKIGKLKAALVDLG